MPNDIDAPNDERAIKAAERIIDDLEGRSGGDGFWGGISPDIQAEIRAEWADIIADALAATRHAALTEAADHLRHFGTSTSAWDEQRAESLERLRDKR
jgi:hypothetical protein